MKKCIKGYEVKVMKALQDIISEHVMKMVSQTAGSAAIVIQKKLHHI